MEAGWGVGEVDAKFIRALWYLNLFMMKENVC